MTVHCCTHRAVLIEHRLQYACLYLHRSPNDYEHHFTATFAPCSILRYGAAHDKYERSRKHIFRSYGGCRCSTDTRTQKRRNAKIRECSFGHKAYPKQKNDWPVAIQLLDLHGYATRRRHWYVVLGLTSSDSSGEHRKPWGMGKHVITVFGNQSEGAMPCK
jgi:hypothetical protein